MRNTLYFAVKESLVHASEIFGSIFSSSFFSFINQGLLWHYQVRSKFNFKVQLRFGKLNFSFRGKASNSVFWKTDVCYMFLKAKN